MFTGIITNTSLVKTHQKRGKILTVTFARPESWVDLALGESIASDGVCLTVSAIRDGEYDCDLVAETLTKTTFGKQLPAAVNLERAMTTGDRFGGHFVQGHVDGMGKISQIDKSDGYQISVEFDPKYRELIMYKGSITVNGVSLTVANIKKANNLTIALVPHTLQNTTLDQLKVGDYVNLEFDMIGKQIANIMEIREYAAR